MRLVKKFLPTFAIVATLAACGSYCQSADAAPAAAAPADPAPAAAAPAPSSGTQVSVDLNWDSGPLDRAYRAEREAIEVRHAREISHPLPGENAAQREQRQARENQALEARYTRGKQTHAKSFCRNGIA